MPIVGILRFPSVCIVGGDIHKNNKTIMGQIRLDDYTHFIIYIELSD